MSESYYPLHEVLKQNVDSIFRARIGGFSPFTYSTACILEGLIKEKIFSQESLAAYKQPFSSDNRHVIFLELAKRCEHDEDYHLCISIINATFSLATDYESGYPPFSPTILFTFLQEKVYQTLKRTTLKKV